MAGLIKKTTLITLPLRVSLDGNVMSKIWLGTEFGLYDCIAQEQRLITFKEGELSLNATPTFRCMPNPVSFVALLAAVPARVTKWTSPIHCWPCLQKIAALRSTCDKPKLQQTPNSSAPPPSLAARHRCLQKFFPTLQSTGCTWHPASGASASA